MTTGRPGPFRRAALLLVLACAGCGLPRWPAHGPLTSPFGLRTLRGSVGIHEGVDVGVPTGTEVHAMSRGSVTLAGPKTGYGLAVVVDHGWGWSTLYAHLSSVRVEVGDHVSAGQVLGLSGNTGDSTGPHLHFEIHHFGRPLDPVPLLGGFP